MKEIKILIKIDGEGERLGFAIQRDEGDIDSVEEVLKIIGALDVLRLRELDRLKKMSSVRFKK